MKVFPGAHCPCRSDLLNRWDGAGRSRKFSCVELDPRTVSHIDLRAKILCALDRNGEAVAIQKQGTAVNPIEHPGAMAEISLCTRMYDAAISDALLRLESFPAAPDVLDDLANSYHWKGMDRQAAEMRERDLRQKAIRLRLPAFTARLTLEVTARRSVARCSLREKSALASSFCCWSCSSTRHPGRAR